MKYNSLLLIVLALLLSSCKEDFSVWKKWNETWLEQTNKPRIEALKENPASEGFVSAGITESGIQYEVRHTGFGIVAKRSSTVRVTYTNFLIDGTAVGYGNDMLFSMSDLVEGWQEMICERGLKEGANFTIYIPWHLAYGKNGNKTATMARYYIPPYSTLISNIEIMDVVNALPN